MIVGRLLQRWTLIASSDRLSVKVSNLAMVSGSLVAPSLESEESLPSARVTVTLYSSTCFSCTKGNWSLGRYGKCKQAVSSCSGLFGAGCTLSLLTHYCYTHLIGAFLTIGTKTCVTSQLHGAPSASHHGWFSQLGAAVQESPTLRPYFMQNWKYIYIYTYNNILCITVLYLYHYIIKYCYYDILWFMMLNVITWYWRVITGHSNQ